MQSSDEGFLTLRFNRFGKAWGGQVGYCDQGVCKALEATAAPTTAQATSTVVSTPTELPGASSVSSNAPGVTATATEEDVTVAQSAESTTVATTPAPVPAVPVVRPPWRPGFVGVKCDRAYPARVSSGRVAKCRFLCGGYPTLGIGFEEDGTPCWRKKTIEGVCIDGLCKALPPTTEATTVQEESSTTSSSATQAGAFETMGSDESSTQSTPDTENVETLSTSPSSRVQEGDDTNIIQGVTAEGAESTTAQSELVTSEQQTGPEEQATTTSSSPSEDKQTHTEENVSEAAKSATTVESRPTDNTGNVVEVTAALEQTTVESVPESTVVQTIGADLDGSGQKKTPSADEVTASNEVEGDEAQGSTATDAVIGEGEEEGSGNTDEQTDSSVSSQDDTTSSSGVEEVVAVVSETNAVIVNASTQPAAEATADGDTKPETDEPQTSQASVTTAGFHGSTNAGAYERGGVSFTEVDHDAQSPASAVTGDFEEDTETQSTDKEVVAVVTVSSLENPAASAQEEAVDQAASTPAADLVPTTASNEDGSNVEQELTEDVSFATTERAIQATTASVESETIKVITTVTRNEIIRPVGADDLSEATLVDTTRTTSVETLPVSKLNDTIKTTRKQSDVSVSSDNPSVVEGETVVGSQDGSPDGALVNEIEAGATTVSNAEAVDVELAGTEAPEEKSATVSDETPERMTVVDESATVKVVTSITEKEVTRPTDEEANQSAVASVDTTQTTSVEAVPLSEVEDEVTSSEESEVSETPTDDEEKLQPEEAAAEVSTFAVADEAFESTTAAAATESATVKVITTVTHKEIVRPVDSHDSQSDTTVVDTSKTTSVETLAVSEVDKLSTSKAQDSAAAESTTVSEEVFKTVQDAAEVSSVTVADESSESTTTAASAEPATVKVITTVTRKEIVRPVGSDDSPSDATVVDASKITSVETLSASDYQNADDSNTVQSEVAPSAGITAAPDELLDETDPSVYINVRSKYNSSFPTACGLGGKGGGTDEGSRKRVEEVAGVLEDRRRRERRLLT
ncbi:hypothetical protein HPB51_004922 [Rhipicephalus microplus]|uniref:Uncharacterized protein n=1 Tax=Rhipicephalus microplus TaxID=6941 RepID=A0A9J6EWT8_RHIMP|nr:hypothetical protein HPB51_004922 [Rhipicephalus microplus]